MPFQPISLRAILVLFSYLRLGIQSGLFMFPHQNPACISVLPNMCHLHDLIILDLIIQLILIEEYKS